MFTSLEGALTEKNFVRVNKFLEVKGHPGVFALGDIIDWAEQKQAAKAMGHAGVVSANVVSYVEGKPLKKAYKGSPEMILLPLGKVRPVSVSCIGDGRAENSAAQGRGLHGHCLGYDHGRFHDADDQGQGPAHGHDAQGARLVWVICRCFHVLWAPLYPTVCARTSVPILLFLSFCYITLYSYTDLMPPFYFLPMSISQTRTANKP